MQQTLGRPVALNYGPDKITCQLNVEVPISLKRALAENAERNSRRLADEVRHALTSHLAARAAPVER